MRPRFLVAASLALLGTAPFIATHAQLLNPFPYSTGRGLRQDDVNMVLDLSNQINAAHPAPKSPMRWTNPASGNSGTIALVRSFQSDGMPCNLLRYRFNLRHPSRHSTYRMGWCQTPDGEWKTNGQSTIPQ